MCGFAGVVSLGKQPLPRNLDSLLKTMGDRIAYRGPDDEQFHADQSSGFVFRRLSIVDLAGGRQPFLNEDGNLLLMVNGEIYNHRELRTRLRGQHIFASDSDCEVILHLYEEQGPACLQEVNGMFALALWDKRQRRLLLARDRLGIKPLYYTVSNQRLLFGSEIKTLLAWPDCPREFDWEASLAFPATRWQAHPDKPLTSFFKGINYLPGGGLLTLDAAAGAWKEERYWSLAENPPQIVADMDEASAIARYRELLEDAVRLRLMADVELGIFLSGGIDSAVIAALAGKHAPYHTFSVLARCTLGNGDAPLAERSARQLGLPNHQVLFDWQQLPLSPQQWKTLLWTVETPLCDAEKLYKFQLHHYARLARPDLKIILLGQGSDEFNGGYGHHWLRHLPEAKQSWSAFMGHFSRMQRHDQLCRANPGLNYYDGCFHTPLISRDFISGLQEIQAESQPWHYHRNAYLYNLQMYNLWHEDRTAAGNSIENRVPFLDHRLVEFTASIPYGLHETLFWDKRILREACRGLLPEEIISRPKIPFFYGKDIRYSRQMLFKLLLADERALLREAFGEPGRTHPVLEHKALEQALQQIPRDPAFEKLEELLFLVNMGLLETMARGSGPEAEDSTSWPVMERVPIEDWEQDIEPIARRLGVVQELPLDRPLSFAKGVMVLEHANSTQQSPALYLSVDRTLRFRVDREENGDWARLLCAVDGQRTLQQLVSATNSDLDTVLPRLEETLNLGLLQFA